jgi:uncharacterized protein (TIGR03067 family)
MRTTLVLGLAVSLAAPLAADDKKFDASKLVGNWEYKSGEKNGQKPSEDSLKAKIKITKDTITVGEGDMLFEFKYTLDTKTDPVAIDMTMTKSPFNMEMKAKGIIGFDGDDIKLCYAPEGERPAKFDGAKAHYFVLKKAK